MAKFQNLCSIFLAIAFLIYACAPGTTIPPASPTITQAVHLPTPSPTIPELQNPNPSPFPTHPKVPMDYPMAVWAAIEDLALRLEVTPDQLQVISFQEEEWPDSCLGLAAPDEMCLQVITPGYRILLQMNNQSYEYHTDQSGEILRVIGEAVLEPIKPGLDLVHP